MIHRTHTLDRSSTGLMVKMFMVVLLLHIEGMRWQVKTSLLFFRVIAKLQKERRFLKLHRRIRYSYTSLIMDLQACLHSQPEIIFTQIIWTTPLRRCTKRKSTEKCWSTLKHAKADLCLKKVFYQTTTYTQQQLPTLQRAPGLLTAHLRTKLEGNQLEAVWLMNTLKIGLKIAICISKLRQANQSVTSIKKSRQKL